MNIKKIIKMYYRIAMVIAVCCFFVPMFTVSCTYGNKKCEISAFDIMMGLKEVLSEPEYYPAVVVLLIIPFFILILDLSKNISIERIPAVYLFGSFSEIAGWIVLKEWLNYRLNDSLDSFQKSLVETKTNSSFYFIIVICVFSGIASFYDMYNKDMSYSGGSISSFDMDELINKIKMIFVKYPKNGYSEYSNRSSSETEIIYACFRDQKTFAINNIINPKCPICKSEMVSTGIKSIIWDNLSSETRKAIIKDTYDKYYNK